MNYATLLRCIGFIGWLGMWPSSSAAQTWQWAVAPGNSSVSYSEVAAMAADADGTTVVAGSFSGTLTLGRFTLTSAGRTDVFVARLDSAGTWVQAVRAGSSNLCQATAVVIDADGTVVVGGSFSGSTSGFGPFTLTNADALGNSADAFVARLSRAGVWVQAVRAGGPSREGVTTLALDGQGNVVVGGLFTSAVADVGPFQLANAYVGTSNFVSDDIFVARLTRAGTWVQAVRAGGPSHDYPTALVLKADGTVVVAGNFFSAVARFGTLDLVNAGPQTAADVFVARLSPAGTWTTASRTGGPYYDAVSALALAADGSLVVAGSFNGPTTTIGRFPLLNADNTGQYSDAYVARLDRSGSWTQAVRAGGVTSDAAIRLAANADGSVAVAGYFTGSASFGPFTLRSAGGNDLCVARLSAAGQWTRVQQAGGGGDDGVFGFAYKDSTDFTIAGRMGSPTARFGPFTLVNQSALFPNAYVAHYGRAAKGPVDPPVAVPALFLPNIITPNGDGKNDVLRIVGLESGAWQLRVYNRWGQPVYQAAPYRQDWNAAGLADGVYYYWLHETQTKQQVKGWLEVHR